MKKSRLVIATMLFFTVLIGLTAVMPAFAYPVDPDNRPFLHWYWENQHATVINAELLTSNEQILENHETFVNLAREYSMRDPLLNVYGVRETRANRDTEMDAFLVGLKANNLVYLIHVADKNPMAKKWAIRELKLMGKLSKDQKLIDKFNYWIDLMKKNTVASTRISHMYVHYIIDISEIFSSRSGYGPRFNFVLGTLLNDFLVANLVENQGWIDADQQFLKNFYSIRRFWDFNRYPVLSWWKFNRSDLKLQGAADKASKCLDVIMKRNTNRGMGNKPYKSNQ